MKIYISTPIKNRKELEAFNAALGRLKDKGHSLIDVYKNETYPLPEDVDYLVERFKRSERAIRQADIVIVEVTYPGRRIGFEIARALDQKKIVIALYHKDKAKSVSTLAGNREKNFILNHYTSDTIDEVLEESLKEAKDRADTKFILIISPEIDKYLEWSSSERRMHKAQIVRNAVEEAMAKDKEYKDFLKSFD